MSNTRISSVDPVAPVARRRETERDVGRERQQQGSQSAAKQAERSPPDPVPKPREGVDEYV